MQVDDPKDSWELDLGNLWMQMILPHRLCGLLSTFVISLSCSLSFLSL